MTTAEAERRADDLLIAYAVLAYNTAHGHRTDLDWQRIEQLWEAPNE